VCEDFRGVGVFLHWAVDNNFGGIGVNEIVLW
jgi:hypothetical protein